MTLKEAKKIPGEYCCIEGKNTVVVFNSRNGFLTVWTFITELDRPFYNYIEKFPNQKVLNKMDWRPNFDHIDFDGNKKQKIWPVFSKETTNV